MTDLRLKCSSCSQTLKVPDRYSGRVVACPTCDQKMRVPEVVMQATLIEEDPEPVDVEPEPSPQKPARENLAPVEWLAGFMFVGPVLAPVWAIQGNAKWKLMAAFSFALYCVTGSLLFWQKDNISAWYSGDGQTQVAEKEDVSAGGLVSGDSTYQDPNIDDSDFVEDDGSPVDDGYSQEDAEAAQREMARRSVEEARRRQEAAEAMMAPPAKDDLLQMDAIRQRAYRANVRIDIQGFGLGSGIVCELPGDHAIILTNRHVIDPNFKNSDTLTVDPAELPEVLVTYVDGSKLPGEVIWVADDRVDLAVVKAECPDEGVRIADWRELPRIQVGERCFAVGNPAGLGWTMTQGSVSALRQRKLETISVPIVQVDATINRGNSGGGLYNSRGQLIGINNFIINPAVALNTGFAIRAEILRLIQPRGLQFKVE